MPFDDARMRTQPPSADIVRRSGVEELPMHKTVFLLDGPIGVGKTTLGRLAAEELGFGFVDRDDLSIPGPWLRSILRTSRKTVEACATSIRIHEGVIVAGPVRCIEWRFFLTSFHRMEIACHCIGLIASSDVIEARERKLNAGELDRSRRDDPPRIWATTFQHREYSH